MNHFEMSQNKQFLTPALKQGIDAPYSCQGGIAIVVWRVTSGTANDENSILTDGEITWTYSYLSSTPTSEVSM
jgi:ring-1,2-phenylacetyl-CoA epoxidase subunit PaaE